MMQRIFFAFTLLIVMVKFDSTVAQGCGGLLDSVLARLDSHDQQLTALRAQSNKTAAFSVRLDQYNRDLNIGDSAPIVFNTVVTNIGNGYNSQTGYFTAPYSGVYAFYFHMRSTNNYPSLVVSIYKNNEELMQSTADGTGNYWNRGNVLVTTHANAGDRIYCRHAALSTWLEGGPLTQFSGALIHAD